MSDGSASHHSSIEHIPRYDYVAEEEEKPAHIQPSHNPEIGTGIDVHEQRKEENPLPIPPYPERDQTANEQVAFDFTLGQANAVADEKLNLNDRDPLKQNQGVKTSFMEVFAEPDPSYHSIACVWTFSFRTFEITRIYVYKVLTLILGLPVALIMGFLFALATFFHIWIIKPLIRLLRIGLHQIFIVWPMILIYIVRPCFYSVGAIFSTFRLHQTQGPIIEEPWMVLVERP